MIVRKLLIASSCALIAASVLHAAEPVGHASAAEISRQVAVLKKGMKPGQGFAWARLMGSGDEVAGLEVWRKPGKPAVHPAQAEYARVISGAGVLESGGELVEASTTRPDLVEGSRISGGTRRTLKPGDVILIPAGVPHWFGITGGELVLLGIKLPSGSGPR